MTTKTLGISTYPEKAGEKETIKYLNLAYKFGFRRVFGNLLGIEDNKAGREKLKIYRSVYSHAKKLGFEVTLDVNPKVFEALKLQPDNYSFFKSLGATGIRYDEDFKGEIESKVSQDFGVELNASSYLETIENTIKLNGNPGKIVASHNFYPMKDTGLSFGKFSRNSALVHNLGIRVAMFISLDKKYKGVGPYNVNDGLTTLEIFREKTTLEQLVQSLAFRDISIISLAEQLDISSAEKLFPKMQNILNEYNEFIKEDTIELRIKLGKATDVEKNILFKNKGNYHYNRPDYNEYFVRSTMPRIYYKDEKIEPHDTSNQVTTGDVVILNNKKGRYKGEMHIILKTINDKGEEFRNVVGRVISSDINKIFWIQDSDKKIKLIKS